MHSPLQLAAFRRVLVLAFAPLLGAWVPAGVQAPGSGAHAVPGEAAWRSALEEQLALEEYRASLARGVLQAPNRAHGLRATFGPAGVVLEERDPSVGGRLVELRLQRFGRGDTLLPVSGGSVRSTDSRVEILRPDLVEWYENSPRGVEQGFTLAARPSGAGALVLEVEVRGAQVVAHGEGARIHGPGRRLDYGAPIAFDRDGALVPVTLEVCAGRWLRLVVEDREAEYPLVVDPLITSVADHFLESNQADPPGFKSNAFGASISAAGDVNGDGYGDVFVGAPGWDGGDFHEGAVFVFLGGPNGLVGTNPAQAQAHLESNQAGAQFGTLDAAGDVNGDGYDDLVVGAHFYRDAIENGTLAVDGAAFVFLGSPSGIVGSDPSTAHAHIRATVLSSELGLAVAGAGDLNGDGYDDLALAAPEQGIPFPPPIAINQSSGNGGQVGIFLGGPIGIASGFLTDADATLTPYPPGLPVASGTLLGFSLDGAGDLNDDGFDDLLVGAPGWSHGAVLVFLGSPGGLVGRDPTSAHALIDGNATTPLGLTLAKAGDVNQDGYPDVLAGSVNHSPGDPFLDSQEGALLIFHGGPQGIAATSPLDADTFVVGNVFAQWLSISVDGAGDVDGDGYDDVLAGARVYAGSLFNEGVGYVFRGGPNGVEASTLLDAYVRLETNQTEAGYLGNRNGTAVAGAGDVNGDGFDDVLLGAGFYTNGEEHEGAVFVYHGGPASGVPNQPPVAVPGNDQIVVDVDNDGAETLTFDGSASFDPDGSIASYAWWEGETLLGTAPILVLDVAVGDHRLALTVTDDQGLTRGAEVFVLVEAAELDLVGVEYFDSGDLGGGGQEWSGPWAATGDAGVEAGSAFSPPFHAHLGAAGASLARSIDLPPGATGLHLRFWAYASGFAPTDSALVRASVDGGPFATVHTLTAADGLDSFVFHKPNHSWYPTAASTVRIEFLSSMNQGTLFVDDVIAYAILGPGPNQAPVAHAGADQAAVDEDHDGSHAFLLDGSASFDSDGAVTSWEWFDGPTLVGTGPGPQVDLPMGAHTLDLRVTDDDGAQATDSVVLSLSAVNLSTQDGFESGGFGGGTGQWVGSWSAGPDTEVRTGGGPVEGSQHVRMRKDDSYLRRTVDLSGTAGASLGYWGKAVDFEGSDRVRVRVSADGGAFQTLHTLEVADSDNAYHHYEVDLSGFPATADLRLEFDSDVDKGEFYLDDVSVQGLAPPPPNAGPVALAGPDQRRMDRDGDGLESFLLDGLASHDPDGSLSAYEWRQGSTVLGTEPALVVELEVGVHLVQLLVTDSEGATDTDRVRLEVETRLPDVAPPLTLPFRPRRP